jgi:cytochrome c nitrite reductase small subunit
MTEDSGNGPGDPSSKVGSLGDPGASQTPSRAMRARRSAGPWLIVLCVLVGVAGGLSAFTFRYAEGLSYLSREPSACVNCHIMRSQYDSWQKGSHHAVAVCIDCHLPHGFIAKYLAKAENGWRHSEKFTSQTFVEPIRVAPHGMAILQENCVACHGDLVHEIAGGPRGRHDELTCVHCHAGAGHGERAGLGGPLRERGTQASPQTK